MRGGSNVQLKESDKDPGHKLFVVYPEMLVQICRDYPGLPDPRTLRMVEIRFFYNGVRGELLRHTAG